MGESRRFSPGDKQQEATHLHFQRPAPSATLLPRRAIVRIYLGALRPRGLGEGPQNLPRPQPPTSASRGLGWRACPGQPDPGVGGFRQGLTPKVGKKTDPALRARLTKGGWEPDLGAEARVCSWGSGPGLRRGRSTSKPRPAPWPFATGSRAGGRRKNTRGRAVGRGLVPAGHPLSPRLWRGVGASCAGSRGLPARGVHTGSGLERGRRPPLPPGPAASLPPPAWRAAAATARAAGGARNGARLAASPHGGERGSPGARRPQARDLRNGLRHQPLARSAVPRGSLGHGPAEGPLPAPGAQRQQGKEGGRRE